MVNAVDNTQTIKDLIAAKSPVDVSKSPDPEFCAAIFISIDLTNSTSFKSREKIWPLVVSKFYELCIKDIQANIEATVVWKHLGDEVIFFKVITAIEQVSEAVMRGCLALKTVLGQLNNSFPETKGVLDLKGAAWIATIWRYPPNSIKDIKDKLNTIDFHRSNNIVSSEFENVRSGPIEFLGRDIDLGFRISKYAHRQKFVLSPDVAKLIFDDAKSKPHGPSNTVRQVSTERLKGVWFDRPCPILWYYIDWENIEDTFHYDEVDSDLYKFALKGKSTSDTEKKLDKIYTDNGFERHFHMLIEAINNPTFDLKKYDHNIEVERLSELHVVAVCSTSSEKTMIAKRKDNKKIEPGKWEFGCNQLRRNTTFHESIKQGYKSDFGIEIEEISPLPVSDYFIETKGVPGLVFAARVSDQEMRKAKIVGGKHDELRWVTLEEAILMTDDKFVPNGLERIRNALEFFRR